MRIIVRRAWTLPSLAGAIALVVVAAGAVAAVETDTVSTFSRGLWWSVALITTVGFLGGPPTSAIGAVLSVALMVSGFLLLALISAALASIFVREDERPAEAIEHAELLALRAEIVGLREQVSALRPANGSPPSSAGHTTDAEQELDERKVGSQCS